MAIVSAIGQCRLGEGGQPSGAEQQVRPCQDQTEAMGR